MPHGSQREIAAELEIDASYVSRVVSGDIRPKTENGRQQLLRVQIAVAQKLDRPLEDVFPAEHDTATAAA